MFDKKTFFDHFRNNKPNREHDRVVVDFTGNRWGFYATENIYENLNTGKVLTAPLFEDMQNQQSDAASAQGSASDDGGFGFSNRSKNLSFKIRDLLRGRFKGKRGDALRQAGNFELTPDRFNKLRVRDIKLSKQFPLKTDGTVNLSYKIKGGTPPYNETIVWYVDGGVTSGVGGVQPTKSLDIGSRGHNSKFTAKLTVRDSAVPSARVVAQAGMTGIIMQPISWTGFTISPETVEGDGTVRLQFDGLTGSPEYLNVPGADPLPFPTGMRKDYYLYIGIHEDVGPTRARLTSSDDFATANLETYSDINYVFPNGVGLSGAASLSNNAQTVYANISNESTVTVGDLALTQIVLDDPFNGTDKIITDAGFALGKSVSYLTLSGTGDSSHPTIEYYDHGSSRWRVLNVVWTGTSWTATDVPFKASPVTDWNIDPWWSVRVRYAEEPQNAANSTNRFRPGVVISSLSQSERENIWLKESLADAGTVLNEKQCQLLCYTLGEGDEDIDWTDDSASGWSQYQERQLVTNETYSSTAGSCVSTPIVAMANIFARLVPQYPIMLVDNQWAGSSRRELGEDDNSGRTWKALEKQILWLSNRNSYIGIQDEMWWNSDAGVANNWSEYFCPLYTKQYSDGTEYTIGSTMDSNKVGSDDEQGYDHCFFDLNVSPDKLGEGVFRRDRTTLSVMGTNTFNDWDASGSQGTDIIDDPYGDAIRRNAESAFQTAGATSGSVGTSARSTNMRKLRQSLGQIFDDTTEYHPMRKVFSTWSHDATLCLYGDYNSTDGVYDDSTHPAKGGSIADAPYQFEVNGIHGWVLTAKYIALSVAKCLKNNSDIVPDNIKLPVPQLIISRVENNGKTITFKAVDENGNDLPDGYKLSTYRNSATGIDRGTEKDNDSAQSDELHTGINDLRKLQPHYRQIPEILGFDCITAADVTTSTTTNLNVGVSGTGFNTAPNSELTWNNWLFNPYSVVFNDDDTFTLTFDRTPPADYYIRFGWGSLPATTRQHGIHDKHYMNMPIVTVPTLASNRQDGTGDETTGLRNNSLDNLIGLPVSGYPRTPIWSIDVSENTAEKKNQHSFTKLNKTKIPTIADGGLAAEEWTGFNESAEAVQGDVVNNPQLNYRPPARFITPIVNEFEPGAEMQVIVHPYNGWEADYVGSSNGPNKIQKVEFFLNGGAACEGVKKTIKGNLEVWVAKLPQTISQDLSEVRAKVYPKHGKVRVLQGQGFFTARECYDIFGIRRKHAGPTMTQYEYRPYLDGMFPRSRGCKIQKGLVDYYVSPSGSDTTGDGSQTNPYQTPGKVYQTHGTKVKIHNLYKKSNALHWSDYVVRWDTMLGGPANFDDISVSREFLPIIEGGTVFGNNGTSPATGRVLGSIFRDVDFRVDTTELSSHTQFSFQSDNAKSRFVWMNCDFGPDAAVDAKGTGFGEIESQSQLGGLPGLKMEVKGVGEGSPTFFYDCDMRYTTVSTSRETVNCHFINPPTQNDVSNAQLMVNCSVKDCGPWMYPYGSVAHASITFCQKGEVNSYTALTDADVTSIRNAAGQYTLKQLDDKLEAFYESLGAPPPAGGTVMQINPNAATEGIKYIVPRDINDGAAFTIVESAYNEIPNLGFYPDYIFMLKRGTRTAGDRKEINVGSVFEPTYVNTNNGFKAARDPHFDLTQTFNESDWGVTSDVRKENGSVFNTIIAGYDVFGKDNNYQGLFFADNSRPDESALWNIRLERFENSQSTLFTMTGSPSIWGPTENWNPETNLDPDTIWPYFAGGSGGITMAVSRYLRFCHIGPNIVAPPPGQGGFKISNMPGGAAAPPDGNPEAKDVFWYETDGFTFGSESTATPSGQDGWDLTPNKHLTQIEGNHWQVSDRPNIEVHLASIGLTYDDATFNETLLSTPLGSGVTPAIGPFRYYSSPLNSDSTNFVIGDSIGNCVTSGQIRFSFWGPLNDRNGTQIHAGNTGNIQEHVDQAANTAYTQTLFDNRIEVHVHYTNNDGAGVTAVYEAGDETNEQDGYIFLNRNSSKTPGITTAGEIIITLVQS